MKRISIRICDLFLGCCLGDRSGCGTRRCRLRPATPAAGGRLPQVPGAVVWAWGEASAQQWPLTLPANSELIVAHRRRARPVRLGEGFKFTRRCDLR